MDDPDTAADALPFESMARPGDAAVRPRRSQAGRQPPQSNVVEQSRGNQIFNSAAVAERSDCPGAFCRLKIENLLRLAGLTPTRPPERSELGRRAVRFKTCRLANRHVDGTARTSVRSDSPYRRSHRLVLRRLAVVSCGFLDLLMGGVGVRRGRPNHDTLCVLAILSTSGGWRRMNHRGLYGCTQK